MSSNLWSITVPSQSGGPVFYRDRQGILGVISGSTTFPGERTLLRVSACVARRGPVACDMAPMAPRGP